jgi:hypothetical protein
MEGFVFWWSVISTILGIIFLLINVAQLVAYVKEKSLILKEKEIHKSQVKVWQHHASGIEMGLFVVTLGKFSTVDDLRESVKGLHQTARFLTQSLNEERLFTDEEIKAKQIENERRTQEGLKHAEQQNQTK